MSSALTTARRELTEFRRGEGQFALRCSGLEKRLGKFHLRDISFELVPGEILGVVGLNASGKSTLLDILAGRLRQDSGELAYPSLCEGRTDWRLVRHRVAYVPQAPQPKSGSLFDHLRLAAAAHGFHGQRNLEEVIHVLYRLGLEDYLGYWWEHLSGGYKVRFELALALLSNPTLLILDEPLAPLDIQMQQVFLEDLADLAGSVTRPLAIVVSSQHLDEIESIATHLLFLDRGVPRYYGERGGLLQERENDRFELDCDRSQESVARLLENFGPVRVSRTGSVLTVDLPRSIGAARALRVLLDQEVTVRYFRDISQSSRRLFETSGEADGGHQ